MSDTPSPKRCMTLNLSTEMMVALGQLAQKKKLSKTELIRKALRLYAHLEPRLEAGYRLKFVPPPGAKENPPLIIVGAGWEGMD